MFALSLNLPYYVAVSLRPPVLLRMHDGSFEKRIRIAVLFFTCSFYFHFLNWSQSIRTFVLVIKTKFSSVTIFDVMLDLAKLALVKLFILFAHIKCCFVCQSKSLSIDYMW